MTIRSICFLEKISFASQSLLAIGLPPIFSDVFSRTESPVISLYLRRSRANTSSPVTVWILQLPSI